MPPRTGHQRISNPAAHDWFTMLPNLLDVWRDEAGHLLEPAAIRVYFHYARLCGTNRDGHAEESVRETSRNTEMSLGLVQKARTRLAETGWITLQYEGPYGHEIAVITLTDRWTENSEYWARLRPKPAPTPAHPATTDLRSNSERNGVGVHENEVCVHESAVGVHENEVCVHESAPTVSANNLTSYLKTVDREDKKEPEDRACARDARSRDDFECSSCGGDGAIIQLGPGPKVCVACASKASAHGARASPARST